MHDTVAFQKLGIMGTGRVASALGRVLAPNSVSPVSVWGRTPAHCDALVRQLGAAETCDTISELAQTCDCIMIAVADDALGEIVAQLHAVFPSRSSPLVFHVSGRSGVAVLSTLENGGALAAAIHPVMTFTGDAQADAQNVIGAHFAITASSASAMDRAKELVCLLDGIAVEIAEEDRSLYHAALSHAANHLVTLIAQASRMLESAGIHEPRPLLAPLVRAALENSLSQGFSALSGPLLRGDRQTIAGHLSALEEEGSEIRAAYRAFALSTLDELERVGKPVSVELRQLLE